MTVYLLLFSAIGFFAIEIPLLSHRTQKQLLAVFCIVMWAAGASRDRVGGDWYQYVDHFIYISQVSFTQSLNFFEPGWVIVNRLSFSMDAGVYGVNAIACLIAMIGIYLICKSTLKPLMGLVVSFPYMYLVVIMGFVRQAVAMSFFAMAIYLYDKNKSWMYASAVCALGLLFHSTAVFAIAFVIAAALLQSPDGSLSKRRLFLFLCLQIVLMYYYVSHFGLGDKYESYSSYDYNPTASRTRAFYNLCVFVLWPNARKNFLSSAIRVLGDICMYASIAGFIGVWFIPLIFDRLIIYFLPLHVIILGNATFGRFTGLARKALVFLFGAYLTVWLMYANNASSWVPYRSVINLRSFLD